VENNLWYAVDSPNASAQTDLPAAEVEPLIGLDPGFDVPADTLSIDHFSISSSSPAWMAGREYEYLSGDFTGACWMDPPSLGAREYRPD